MQLTPKLTLKVVTNLPEPNTIKFRNQLGGWDTVQVNKYKVTELGFKPTTYRNTAGEFTSAVDVNRTETFFSIWLENDAFEWLTELFTSTQVYINNKYYIVQPGKLKFDDFEKLWNFEVVGTPKELKYVTD